MEASLQSEEIASMFSDIERKMHFKTYELDTDITNMKKIN